MSSTTPTPASAGRPRAVPTLRLEPPALADVAAWMGRPADEEGLADSYAAAMRWITSHAVTDPWDAECTVALRELVKLNQGARNKTAGTVNAGPLGLIYEPRYVPTIERALAGKWLGGFA